MSDVKSNNNDATAKVTDGLLKDIERIKRKRGYEGKSEDWQKARDTKDPEYDCLVEYTNDLLRRSSSDAERLFEYNKKFREAVKNYRKALSEYGTGDAEEDIKSTNPEINSAFQKVEEFINNKTIDVYFLHENEFQPDKNKLAKQRIIITGEFENVETISWYRDICASVGGEGAWCDKEYLKEHANQNKEHLKRVFATVPEDQMYIWEMPKIRKADDKPR